ncbi:hypothetical protein NCCP1664_27110 [Zafaria cholistanensis]|uniref:Uncharacterized protein n=1 Tax=Zafaria cholistanensis TaxID=1682741 RepID=A0A5A7NU93_9MICC|nr:hypothetical protein [Zafaria cholistanensis]GER24216.1 hypothetical protein NCCP1664_27110 [Zafaria cholistanensis]
MKTTSLFRLFLAALCAALLAGAVAVPSHAAGAVTVRIPLAGTLSSSAGPLALSGTVHIVLPPSPIIPSNPIRVETNLSRVTASNDQVTCHARGAQQFTLDTATDPFTGTYPFAAPPNPVRPGDVCQELGELTVDFQLTVTEGGEITGATATARTVT